MLPLFAAFILVIASAIITAKYALTILPKRFYSSDTIGFSQYAKGLSYLNRNNVYPPENWGVWSSGREVNMQVPFVLTPPKQLIFNLRAFVSPQHPVQRVRILFNWRPHMEVALTQFDNNFITVDVPDLDELNQMNLTFELPDNVSPNRVGGDSNDDRSIAIGLVSITSK